jgi:hypothetical protein
MYIYVCTYIRIYIHTYVYTYIHTYTYIQVGEGSGNTHVAGSLISVILRTYVGHVYKIQVGEGAGDTHVAGSLGSSGGDLGLYQGILLHMSHICPQYIPHMSFTVVWAPAVAIWAFTKVSL